MGLFCRSEGGRGARGAGPKRCDAPPWTVSPIHSRLSVIPCSDPPRHISLYDRHTVHAEGCMLYLHGIRSDWEQNIYSVFHWGIAAS